jgi:hypothetical protein
MQFYVIMIKRQISLGILVTKILSYEYYKPKNSQLFTLSTNSNFSTDTFVMNKP